MGTSHSVNLYLVGFAGSGKSTVGRAVARELGLTIVDSDHAIEQKQGRPVEQGEAACRGMEREFIEHGHPADGCVVACGGGLVVPDGMPALLRQRGVVLCLHASLEGILARTHQTNHRPLFRGDDREERIRSLYAGRAPIYQRAGTMVLTDHRPLRDIALHVGRVYEREAREWAARHRA